MFQKLKLSFKIILICFTYFIANTSFAFTLVMNDPNLKGYQSDKVVIKYAPTSCPSSISQEIDDAIEVWNSVPTASLVLENGGTTTTTTANFSNISFPEQILIGCSTNFQADTVNPVTPDAGVSPNEAAGVAFPLRISGSSDISKGYIVLNMQTGSTGYLGSNKAARLHAITHEIGHTLGLGHSGESTAIMHYSGLGQTETNVNQDDIDGITYLYPRDELAGDIPFGCASVAVMPKGGPKGPSPGPPYILLMLFPLAVLAYLKKYALVFS